MNFTGETEVDVDVEEVFDEMSDSEKEWMLKKLLSDNPCNTLDVGVNHVQTVNNILNFVQQNLGIGNLYLDELILGIQKIKQGETVL